MNADGPDSNPIGRKDKNIVVYDIYFYPSCGIEPNSPQAQLLRTYYFKEIPAGTKDLKGSKKEKAQHSRPLNQEVQQTVVPGSNLIPGRTATKQ